MSDKFEYDVFLSYSSKDKAVVHELAERLKSDGLRVWFDEWIIKAGNPIPLKIQDGIEKSRRVVMCMSPAFFASEWTKLEHLSRLFRDPTNEQLRFIPLLIKKCKLPDMIAQFAYIDWRDKSDEKYQELLSACLADEETIPESPGIKSKSTKTKKIIKKPTIKPVPVLLSNLQSVRDFVGRGEDLDTLREFYENGKRVFLLHGVPGVGKTALALEFAHEIKGEYAAHIFVDMQGLNRPVLAAEAAMYEVVKQFDPNIPANLSPNELQGIYTQFLSKHKTLLVLDNAEDEQQIEPLNVVDDSCLLVTSRRRFVLKDGELCEVEKMSEPDAKDLLIKICPRISERADDLAERCGHLPLALRAAASALKKNRLTSVEKYIADLQDRKTRLLLADPTRKNLTVGAAFDLSYEMLGTDLQLRWRQLAVFPADFAADGAAAIWETDDPTDTLNDLDSYSLLEVNEETGRFSLHDLARDYTTEKLTKEVFASIQRLHAKHYSEVLRFVGIERGYDYQNALNLLDIEWINITAGQKWSADFTASDKEAAQICIVYSSYVPEFIDMRLHPQDFIKWLSGGLAAAQKLGNRQMEGNSLGNLGNVYDRLGDYRKAIEYHEQSLQISKEIGNRLGESGSLGNLGNTYNNLGDYRKAIEYHEQYLQISKEIGNRRGEGISLGNLGISYNNLGDYRKAIEYHEQSLQISREIGTRLSESPVLGNLGNAYYRLGDYRKAIEYHEQSLQISREIGDKRGEGTSLGNLGVGYFSLGETEKACGLWRESLAILEAIEAPQGNVIRQLLAENCQNGD